MNSSTIYNWIDGKEKPSIANKLIDKFNPHTGGLLSQVTDSSAEDVDSAVSSAQKAFSNWSDFTPVKRGQILSDIVNIMRDNLKELADCVRIETGKPPKDAENEVKGAILQGEFFAGEGMRQYGRTLTSSMFGKQSFTIRQPHGVAALIVPANTPIANIAWKVFPALICGNTVVLKASENAPQIANMFAQLAKAAGLPDGVLNVIHGLGSTAGALIVEHAGVSVISFTGSTPVGQWIAGVAAKRLTRVSLELGGKNSFVVCDDADLDQAVHWALLSAFSNAGQRCAAASRLFVFEDVYEEFRNKFVSRAGQLKIGVDEGCDLGPVINLRQKQNILTAIQEVKNQNGHVLCGGGEPENSELANGYYIQPTVIEGLDNLSLLNCTEIFGPVATIQPIKNLQEAIALSNATRYGLTSAIHTRSIDKAMKFVRYVRTGVANINIGTFGSEPHMPFGGFAESGNGSREPGVEALDVYSELKNVSIFANIID